jgi:phosphohistidine phosphatase
MEGRELLVLRHGKSSWDSSAETDLERPLAKRGKRDTPRIGAWILEEGAVPDLVISSPALRARQTARRVAKSIGLDPEAVVIDERIYYGGVRDILAILGECNAEIDRVMVVGHNPTLESLVGFLGGPSSMEFDAPKFFPTCALARIRMPFDWAELEHGSGEVVELIRPRELAE